MFRKFLCFMLGLMLALPLLPCPGQAREGQEIIVAATFYPVYILARNVLEGVPGVQVTCMAEQHTGCLHDYQLLPRDMRTLSRATVLLSNGAGMEEFLQNIREQLPDLPVIDLSRGVSLLLDEDGEENPHIWLSPPNMMQMAENMREALGDFLPQARAQIDQNTENYLARLRALDGELAAGIAALPHKDIVTFHEAFPYFAERYGLNVVAVAAMEPDDPLSPQMLAQIVRQVRAAGCPPLFAEPQYAGAALRIISQETGAPIYTLDPLSGGEDALTAYEDGMRRNLATLQIALGETGTP